MATAATVGVFTVILTGLLTQYDMAEIKRETKRGGRGNIYRLGLLLEAAQKAEDEVAHLKHRDDKEAVTRYHEALKKHFLYERGQFTLPPLRRLDKMMLAWIEKGTLPKYPVQRRENPACAPCLEENPRTSINFSQAKSQLKRVGASRATGPALTAMYALTIADAHGGKAEKYYAYLSTKHDVKTEARRLLSDRNEAWSALMVKSNPACLDNPCYQANPLSAGALVVAGLVAAAVAWVFWPEPAAAAPATKPALPPAQAQPPLPAPPAPLTTPLPAPAQAAQAPAAATPQAAVIATPPACDPVKIIQYKFKDTEPLVWAFRRLNIVSPMTAKYPSASEEHDEGSWLPAAVVSQEVAFYYGEFGAQVQKSLINTGLSTENPAQDTFWSLELWLWSTDGWCLHRVMKNWT